MAGVPDGQQIDYQKMQLIGSLKAVADQMRTCATMAEHFVQSLSHVPFGGPVPLGRKRRTAEEMSTDGKRKRKPPKDPNAPKRPASSYLIFQNDVRNELKKEHPNLSNNELLSMIAALWQNMPKEKKESYELRQKEKKEEWLQQKAVYDGRTSPGAAPIAAAVAPPIAAPLAMPAQVVSPKSLTKPVSKPAKFVAAPAVTPLSDAEESDDEDGTSSDGSTDDDEEEDAEETQPPPKKSKKEAVSHKAEQPPAKEKKHKVPKA
ncbi:predicted protein [Postia placenta Mad-698-R]|uniref:HMG box domain-containing protein n=1 Tax=Rhodonia placenta TaxID=104341 RepID=A0A8H7U690_9APHY|nr:predicted protein [Postia placenta Mad-698-R]KAF9820998.1 hypothetical protein IEO21_00975 [Postia placenta]